jgi:hypothetical protein
MPRRSSVFSVFALALLRGWRILGTGPSLLVLSGLVAALPQSEAPAAGLRRLPGKHITLYTDLPATAAVDALPEMFDQAFPQWCAYFGVDPVREADWQVTGCVMRDQEPFRAAGLLPGGLPPFKHGYSVGKILWINEQASDYYRAHLLLHEGTHAFVNTILGRGAPPWYMEGIAEMLGTHRWHDGRLTLGYLPASREEVPLWGRVKIVRDDFAARRAKTLRGVFQYGPQAHQEIEPYGWCWAAAIFLDRHPRYQSRFRQLAKQVNTPDLTERFMRLVGSDWDQLAEEWQVFVADLEYGYDFQRTAIDFTPGRNLPAQGAKVTVAADRAWQNSGIRLEGGVTYRLRATGRYQVKKGVRTVFSDQPRAGASPTALENGSDPFLVWWSEPNGVSIRYYRGQPLGILLAAVRPDRSDPDAPSALLRPIPVGLGAELTPRQRGTLFLRINDSSGELADNAGTLSVDVGVRD